MHLNLLAVKLSFTFIFLGHDSLQNWYSNATAMFVKHASLWCFRENRQQNRTREGSNSNNFLVITRSVYGVKIRNYTNSK